MGAFIGETVLTSPIWNWGIKYSEIVDQLMDGSYDGSESYWGGLNDGVVDLASFSPLVSEETKALVEEKRALIESGEWDVFCGPINGADGELLVADGECLSDIQMLSISCFVEGVQGEAPAETATCFGE
jgi:basic membrane protein A